VKYANPTRRSRSTPKPLITRRNELSDEAVMREQLRSTGSSEAEIQREVEESSEEARAQTLMGRAKKGSKK
jgi:hypothetical protein